MPDIVRGNVPQYIPVKQPDIIKPSAYANSTPSVHTKGYTNGHHFNGSGTLSGAAAGSGFGPWGAAIGAAVGLGTDIWQAIYAKKRAKEANEESKKAADAAAARNSAEARAARTYNSEQAQIRRMRMAGLSPGLAYGQMSPSTAQTPTIDKQDVNKADTPKFDNESLLRALEYLVKQQQADTALAAQQSTADLQGSQTQLNLIDSLTRYQSNMAGISKVLADADFTDAQKLKLISMLSGDLRIQEGEIKHLNQSARLAGAQADVVAPVAESQIAHNYAAADLALQQEKTLRLQYGIDENQWNSIQKICSEFKDGELLAPVIMKAVDSLAKEANTTVNHILDNLTYFSGSLFDLLESFLGTDAYKPSHKRKR